MARRLRLEFSGACYHVINRGNYRRNLFQHDGAASAFERCLFETCPRFGWRMHAFVIMRNHFHLAVETPEPNLSEGMKWLQGTWANRFNRFRGEIGRPFQGRYKALLVEPGHVLAQVAHYIHLNPVRANLVSPERLRDYRWSSLPRFAAKGRPPWMEATTLLREGGGLADTPEGWARYLDFLGLLMHGESASEESSERFSRGWMIGSTEFQADLALRLQGHDRRERRFELLGGDHEAFQQVREKIWEEKLREAAAALNLPIANLPAKRSAVEKVRLAALMRRTTSASNEWLTRRLSLGKPTSVSQWLCRFRRHGGEDTPEFKIALSKVAT